MCHTNRIAKRIVALCMMLLVTSVSAADDRQAPPKSAAEWRSRFEQYLNSFRDMKAEFKLTVVSRLAEGRVEAAKSTGTWRAGHDVHRLSFHSGAEVNGKHEWFDVRDAVIRDGALVAWNHAKFPGEVNFGSTTTNKGGVLARDAQLIADPRYTFLRMLQIAKHKSAELSKRTDGSLSLVLRARDVAASVPPGTVTSLPDEEDRLEILLSTEHNWLPVEMVRLNPSAGEPFESGTGLTIRYVRREGTRIVPEIVTENTLFRNNMTGPEYREWEFSGYEFNVTDHGEAMDLQLPMGAVAIDVDSDKRFTLGPANEAEIRGLTGLFPGLIRIVPRGEALSTAALLPSGQSKFLPPIVAEIQRQTQSPAIASRSAEAASRRTIFVGNVLAVMLLLGWASVRSARRRRRDHSA